MEKENTILILTRLIKNLRKHLEDLIAETDIYKTQNIFYKTRANFKEIVKVLNEIIGRPEKREDNMASASQNNLFIEDLSDREEGPTKTTSSGLNVPFLKDLFGNRMSSEELLYIGINFYSELRER